MINPATPPPPKEALDYFRAKGYKIGWDYRDVWKEEHTRAFTVAKVMTQDLLIDIRSALDDALVQGKTFKQFQKELEPLLEKRGWINTPRRLQVIYDTNMRTARSAGQWERIERNKTAIPYLIYGLGPSKEHRHEHTQWDGLILPVDDPFWDTHATPNGWGCKCRIRQISKNEVDRLGGVSKPPVIETKPWHNKRTGETLHVPEGIDPGWDYNPGKSRSGNIKKLSDSKDLEFNKVVGTPEAPVELKQRIAPSAFSTLRNISATDIDDVLQQLPGAEQSLEKVKAFTNEKGLKTLVIRQSEMSARNKASLKIREQVLDYLDEDQRRFGSHNYTIRGVQRVGGFTNASYNHIVVKGNSKVNLKKADKQVIANELTQAVDKAVLANQSDSKDTWALAFGGSKEAETVAVWVHELGHQVHYWAGASSAPNGAKYLTRYSQTNKYEYHAEHFSAWLFNRKALLEFDPEAVKHFDELIEKAVQGKERRR
ncbi:Phage (Mu-like) virion morphogenesis protein [gamma proteobacterium IMCC1989]|nr:Phage (Mu-like) virion morphogenesis protein [gamma proteobacterium IMCC1989]